MSLLHKRLVYSFFLKEAQPSELQKKVSKIRELLSILEKMESSVRSYLEKESFIKFEDSFEEMSVVHQKALDLLNLIQSEILDLKEPLQKTDPLVNEINSISNQLSEFTEFISLTESKLISQDF